MHVTVTFTDVLDIHQDSLSNDNFGGTCCISSVPHRTSYSFAAPEREEVMFRSFGRCSLNFLLFLVLFIYFSSMIFPQFTRGSSGKRNRVYTSAPERNYSASYVLKELS